MLKKLFPKTKIKALKCCYGVSSQASDDKKSHVLYLDYDNIKIETVLDHINYLQRDYHLSDFYLMSSTHGFNAVCLDTLGLYDIFNIGTDILSPCDRNFFKYGYKRGYYTLRFDFCDKKLIKIIESDNRYFIKSLGHKNFLEWFFDITIPLDENFNEYTKIYFVQYPSNKNGYHLVDKKIPSYYEVLKNDER